MMMWWFEPLPILAWVPLSRCQIVLRTLPYCFKSEFIRIRGLYLVFLSSGFTHHVISLKRLWLKLFTIVTWVPLSRHYCTYMDLSDVTQTTIVRRPWSRVPHWYTY